MLIALKPLLRTFEAAAFYMQLFAVRIILLLLLVFGVEVQHCLAQPQPLPEKLTYQLVNDVLIDLHPQTNPVIIRRGPNGNYQASRPRPVDNNEPLLLLDRFNYGWASRQFVENVRGTPEWDVLTKYFTDADIDCMRQQLPVARHFTLKQAEITQPGVKVLAVDTLLALRKRLDWKAPDVLQQRYGTRHTHGIGGCLFSLDYRKALVVVSTDDGWNVYVYENNGVAWYRKATLEKGVE